MIKQLHYAPVPPELAAICALCDVRVEAVYGRPGHTWRLWIRHPVSWDIYARNISTTEPAEWLALCEWLIEQRDRSR